jgi:hypothetical protein
MLCKLRKVAYGWSTEIRDARSKKCLAEVLFWQFLTDENQERKEYGYNKSELNVSGIPNTLN